MTPGRRSLTRLAADAPSAVSTAEPVDSVCPGPWVRATARTGRAAYAENARDTELMRADVQAAYADFERIGDRWGLSSILANRAQLRTMDGDLTGGGRLRAALQYVRVLGSREDTMQITYGCPAAPRGSATTRAPGSMCRRQRIRWQASRG